MRCENCMQPIPSGQYPCPHCGYRIDPQAQNEKYLAPGTKLGQYELGRVLGAGGFGITYIGWDERLQRKVAIKEYFPSNLSTRIPGHTEISVFSGEKAQIFRHGLERFLEEARLLMRFSGQSGIVSIYDVVEANGTAYIVMEYLEGITLRQQISKFGVMDEEHLLKTIMPVMLTLKFLHQDGYVHRDIAPDNLMCLPDGSIKLLDFGAARYFVMEASQTLSVIVKQGFTPIEQYQTHGEQGPWTDVYALGATMYYALTGKVPTESLERLHNDIIKSPMQLGAKVSAQADRAIMSALNVQPGDRPQDLDRLIAALLGQEETTVVHKRRRLPLAAILGIAATALIAVGCVIGIALRDKTPPPPIVDGVSVPNIIGQQVEAASAILENQQLSLLITGGRFYDEALVDAGFVEAGQIMTQDPQSGVSVDADSIVGAEVSKGKKQAYMPDITDMLVENAVQEMENAGFDTNALEIETQERDDLMPGTVISQQTQPEQNTDYDAAQKLLVSAAPSQGSGFSKTESNAFTVGNYEGEAFDTLRDTLLEHHIFLVKSALVYSETAPAGTVISQYPEPDTKLYPGEAVYVVVSRGVERTRVPDVQLLPLDEAKKELIRHGLSWTISYIQDPALAEDLVASQDLEPHTQVDFGSVLKLEVNNANPPADSADGPSPVLDPTELKISVGETYKLDVRYDGSEELYWASSDESIAGVSQDGTVTPHRLGAATIIVGADNKLAFCKITVEDDRRVLCTSRVLAVGETFNCVQELARIDEVPSSILGRLVWRTNAPDILTVSASGEVTTVKPGFGVVVGTCEEQVYQFSISVEDEIEKIEISKKPSKISYVSGQKPDYTGMELTVTYESGKTEKVTSGYSAPKDALTNKNNTVTISYGGKSVALTFEVKAAPQTQPEDRITEIRISKNPAKMSYESGQKPDYTGMELTVTYESGKTEKITSGYSAPKDALSVDHRTVTISYGGLSVSLSFEIKTEAKLEVVTKPTKTDYYIGDKLNLSGLKLRYTGTDGKTKEITSGYKHSADLSAAGNCIVAITYGDAGTEFTVKVKKPSIVARMDKLGDYTMLSAVTDPEGQRYTWSVADPTTAYFDKESTLIPLKNGAITVIATMIYNGISYEDTLTFFVTAEEEYTFRISKSEDAGQLDYWYWDFSIKTDIPDFRAESVQWQYIPGPRNFEYGSEGDYFWVNGELGDMEQTFTVIASYSHNGRTYQDSMTVSVPRRESEKYSFEVGNDGGVYDNLGNWNFFVNTDIPGFRQTDVAWQVSCPNWFKYSIDQAGYCQVSGELGDSETSFTVTATYSYNGKTYQASRLISVPRREENYFFNLSPFDRSGHEGEHYGFIVQSNIPGFSMSNVQWSISGLGDSNGGWLDTDGYYYVDAFGKAGTTFTVTASYVYNGKTYSGSVTITAGT